MIETFGRLDILVNNAGRSQRARWEHTDIKVLHFAKFTKQKAIHTLHFAKQDETHILDEFGIFKSYQIKGPMTLRCFSPGGRGPLCLECFLRCQPDSGGVASYAWEVAFCLFFLDTLCDNLSWILETQFVLTLPFHAFAGALGVLPWCPALLAKLEFPSLELTRAQNTVRMMSQLCFNSHFSF